MWWMDRSFCVADWWDKMSHWFGRVFDRLNGRLFGRADGRVFKSVKESVNRC